MLQSKPVFCLKLQLSSALSHRRGHVLRSVVTLVGPLCFTTTRYQRWVPTAGVRGSCKCSCKHTTPLQVCGSSGSAVITPAFITSPNTLWVLGRAITPPFYHTPKHTLWMFARLITPPLGPLRAALSSPGAHKISHPVIILLNPKMLSPGCVILR